MDMRKGVRQVGLTPFCVPGAVGGMRCGHKRMLTSGSSAAAAAARAVGGAVVV